MFHCFNDLNNVDEYIFLLGNELNPVKSFLNVKIQSISIGKNGECNSFDSQGRFISRSDEIISITVKYSLSNNGSLDFSPLKSSVGMDSSGNPAIKEFMILEGFPGGTLKTHATCVVDDSFIEDGSDACGKAMVIKKGESYGVTQDISVKFPLSESAIEHMHRGYISNSEYILLNIKLSVNKLISEGSADVVSLVLQKSLWGSNGVYHSPVFIYTAPTSSEYTCDLTMYTIKKPSQITL